MGARRPGGAGAGVRKRGVGTEGSLVGIKCSVVGQCVSTWSAKVKETPANGIEWQRGWRYSGAE